MENFMTDFDDLWENGHPAQGYHEFRYFLEFVKDKLPPKPVVVEIGVRKGRQRPFYEYLLDADYRGIDIVEIDGIEFICGDSGSEETLETLKEWLDGRRIDLLFIDGDHSYEAVKRDYELYGPLADIIAFHDIVTKNPEYPGVKIFWDEMEQKGEETKIIEFKIEEPGSKYGATGIGVILK